MRPSRSFITRRGPAVVAAALACLAPARAEDHAHGSGPRDGAHDPWAGLRILDSAVDAVPQGAPTEPLTDEGIPPPRTDSPSRPPAAAENPSPDPQALTTGPRASDADRRLIARPSGETRSSNSIAAPRTESGWLRTGGSLVAVVLLIFLLGWGYRVVAAGGRLTVARGRQPELLQVVARTAVSPRQSLCLVRVGPRLVLIGVGPDRLTALDTITDPAAAAQIAGHAAQRDTRSHSADFERCLEREAKSYDGHDGADEAVAPEESQVSAIKRTLQAAAARLQARTADRSS